MEEEEKKPNKVELSDLDADFIRVLEDLIDALIANGALRLTDLPPQALEKLQQRKNARQRLRNSLNLLDDDDESLF
ncbi:MAG TPA: hypothetical protein DEB15_10955 [Pusillimonas sp.]|jgi:ParB-like chromosome segregation protein Spo0J|nr:hypothetical protein [Pusillimonas sp.]MBC41662.1 hypothetical protein [Pusillimonas sp.]HBT33301.1 hypothetical protein [Pusillimonas sp.]HCN70888.1 hypothetical protein [Pusillimonas sp.]HCP79595.1 hypothetical protein [Pusillimonas sp.]|tara:strand:+ start:135 stop:362 length:228 start_codon:yes stop_codon:yes gene_type:complete